MAGGTGLNLTGADMVMTAHIQFPQIEKETYTSISTGEEVYLPATALSGTAAPSFLVIGNETTSLSPIPSPSREEGNQAWYSLDGRKLDGMPTKKGIYINGGRKVVVR